jgi:Cu2+-exporting ATPase
MASGSAVTQARADLLLVGGHLDAIVFARTVARHARRRIVENLVWAAAYNLSVIPLALTGHFPAWIGAAGMSVSSLVVVLNALRIPRETAT